MCTTCVEMKRMKVPSGGTFSMKVCAWKRGRCRETGAVRKNRDTGRHRDTVAL
jgi:hypothetical protein